MSNSPRDRAVRTMFDRIAGRYDVLNRIISVRLDLRWRRHVVRSVLNRPDSLLLDLGTGTGDLAFDALRESRAVRAVGLDFSLQMLKLAAAKRARAKETGWPALVLGSAMAAPFKSAVFDGAMTAFVLRNVSDRTLFFTEAFRVLKPGAKLVSLEMFPPSTRWFHAVYSIYFHHVMPRIGSLLSRDRDAYRYLSESVRQFSTPEHIGALMRDAGFSNIKIRRFMNGAVCMHVADKPRSSKH